MKKFFVFNILFVFLFSGCVGSKKKKGGRNEKETQIISLEKTKNSHRDAVYKNMKKSGYTFGKVLDKTKTSGCSFVIQINDSSIFEPVNLESKFKKDCLKIAFKHRKSRAMTTCMMGQTVIVSEVKALKEE
tara:strand:- start:307 stop:699 length:393 start_codon:yes stop_codon:yes gene_type:complete